MATYLVSLLPTAEPPRTQASTPSAAESRGAVVDLTERADRLHAGMADVTPYQHPVRNAFQFRERPAPPVPATQPRPIVPEAAPPVAAPVRPPYSLFGVAASATRQTAMLSSLQGVLLVGEGDALDGGYVIRSIGEDSVTIESTADGTVTTLRLATP